MSYRTIGPIVNFVFNPNFYPLHLMALNSHHFADVLLRKYSFTHSHTDTISREWMKLWVVGHKLFAVIFIYAACKRGQGRAVSPADK